MRQLRGFRTPINIMESDTKDIREVEIAKLIDELAAIRESLTALETKFADQLGEIHPTFKYGARNLLHYLAFRSHDIRALQDRLAALGLSSLGRSEGHVMATVSSVLALLRCLAGLPVDEVASNTSGLTFAAGTSLLGTHTESLFGPRPSHRPVRIMVTAGNELAEDYLLVRDLLRHGMECMRINCAHDDSNIWSRMIEHLQRARRELGTDCKILMDLGGPKLRTGPIEDGPQMIAWHPEHDALGRIVRPARVWLVAEGSPLQPIGADAIIPVSNEWLKTVKLSDRIEFQDARGRHRALEITGSTDKALLADCNRTAYITPGTMLIRRVGGTERSTRVGALPTIMQALRLKPRDVLVLTREQILGRPETRQAGRELPIPATVACTLPEVFGQVRPGERIWFDDGKIGGVIRQASADRLVVEIVQAKASGQKLRSDKGINLPDSRLTLPALTGKDLEDLRFVAKRADIVGLSFVRHESDVHELRSHLKELEGERLGIILKIETRQGFERLPNLLLAVMRHHTAGVMIARGDLAVECGYERMAEVQEEMLWVCEAAHMPVVWATQVLETLAKTGRPSRAEITDAAMAERAECVMLNKGAHVIDAVRTLDDIMRRMTAHQGKKTSRLRPLHLTAIHD